MIPDFECIKDFTWVQYAEWIEGFFDRVHRGDLRLAMLHPHEGSFGQADAVFTSNNATQINDFLHQLMNARFGFFSVSYASAIVHDMHVEITIPSVAKGGRGEADLFFERYCVANQFGLLIKRHDYIFIELRIRERKHRL